MQIGLIGFPQSGKRTLMRLLTGVEVAAPSNSSAALPGICPVRDTRIDCLVSMYNPAKITPATIQYLLMPDVTKDSEKNQELLKSLANVDVLAHVVCAFSNESVFHIEGSVDPLRDIASVYSELILNDLLFIEKRLERIAKESKTKGVDKSKEKALLLKLQSHLNENLPLRILELEEHERKLISGTPLLTRKAYLIVLNVDENKLKEKSLIEQVKSAYAIHKAHVVLLSAKIEEELSHFDDENERQAFMSELGILEPAIDGLTRISYEALGLISYFTVGPDEVRAWTIRRGALAPEAGGVIHSDIERGFIRAELIKYDDLISLGSEQAVSSAGKMYLKGKDYLVEDGDILSFRFNV